MPLHETVRQVIESDMPHTKKIVIIMRLIKKVEEEIQEEALNSYDEGYNDGYNQSDEDKEILKNNSLVCG